MVPAQGPPAQPWGPREPESQSGQGCAEQMPLGAVTLRPDPAAPRAESGRSPQRPVSREWAEGPGWLGGPLGVQSDRHYGARCTEGISEVPGTGQEGTAPRCSPPPIAGTQGCRQVCLHPGEGGRPGQTPQRRKRGPQACSLPRGQEGPAWGWNSGPFEPGPWEGPRGQLGRVCRPPCLAWSEQEWARCPACAAEWASVRACVGDCGPGSRRLQPERGAGGLFIAAPETGAINSEGGG